MLTASETSPPVGDMTRVTISNPRALDNIKSLCSIEWSFKSPIAVIFLAGKKRGWSAFVRWRITQRGFFGCIGLRTLAGQGIPGKRVMGKNMNVELKAWGVLLPCRGAGGLCQLALGKLCCEIRSSTFLEWLASFSTACCCQRVLGEAACPLGCAPFTSGSQPPVVCLVPGADTSLCLLLCTCTFAVPWER